MQPKIINYEYHISLSRRPIWLLMFVAQAKSTFDEEYMESDQRGVLNALCSLLDQQVYERRKMQCTGKSIRRDIINDSRMVVFSDTSQTPYLEITFVKS